MSKVSPEFKTLKKLLKDYAGLHLEDSKEYLAQTRLEPLAKEHGAASYHGLLTLLQGKAGPKLLQKIVESMLTSETFFFRDMKPFHTLKDQVIPAIMRDKEKTKKLYIWCCACSTGQEPYSIAMIINEHFPQLKDWDVRIIGSDLSECNLLRARQAEYSDLEMSRGLPEYYKKRYFVKGPDGWKLSAEIKNMVVWQKINLIEPFPILMTMDIIFLRNVLIYFDVSMRQAIYGKIAKVMTPNSYLFLGASETPIGVTEEFTKDGHENIDYFQKVG